MFALQLNPLFPLETPKGKAMAHVMLDYGFEHYVYFLCFIDETGEPWIFDQRQVRMQANITARPEKAPK